MTEGDVNDLSEAYVPLCVFVNSPPEDHGSRTCVEYIQQVADVLPGVYCPAALVEEAKRVADTRLNLRGPQRVGDRRMCLAITMYTMDGSITDPTVQRERNFYFMLNVELRKRKIAFQRAAHGYLYLFMTGLHKLPPVTGRVLRGIDARKAPRVLQKAIPGRNLHWSGFSSSTPDESTAIEFANAAGPGGCVLEITLLETDSQARDINEFSPYPEGEVLLMPNFRLFVMSHTVKYGLTWVTMHERAVGGPVVDF